MLEAYFDETQRGDELSIAGFVAPETQWALFSAAWIESLQCAQVAGFHAHEFFSPNASRYRHLGRFERTQHLDRLLSVIGASLTVGVGATIDVREHSALVDPATRSKYGSAYATCFWGCVIDLLGPILAGLGLNAEPIRIILESGHKNAEDALSRLLSYQDTAKRIDTSDVDRLYGFDCAMKDPILQISSVSLGNKEEVPGLQAADLLAYCFGRVTVDPVDPKWGPVAAHIMSTVPVKKAVLGQDYLLRFIETMRNRDSAENENRTMRHQSRRFLQMRGIKFEDSDGVLRFGAPADQLDELLKSLDRLWDADAGD